MKAIMNVIILSLLVCGSAFSQTKSYSWDEIKNRTVCSSGTQEDVQKEIKCISKQLGKHTKNFKKRWWKYHTRIGKDAKKNILSNMDYFYVPRYKIVDTISNSMEMQLSKNCVDFIFFVSGSNYLGCYNSCNCEWSRVNKKKCSPTDKTNYNVAISRCAQADVAFAIDFFWKGRPVFSLENYVGERFVWFSSDGIKPIKFDSNDIRSKIIHYDMESSYKQQFYEK